MQPRERYGQQQHAVFVGNELRLAAVNGSHQLPAKQVVAGRLLNRSMQYLAGLAVPERERGPERLFERRGISAPVPVRDRPRRAAGRRRWRFQQWPTWSNHGNDESGSRTMLVNAYYSRLKKRSSPKHPATGESPPPASNRTFFPCNAGGARRCGAIAASDASGITASGKRRGGRSRLAYDPLSPASGANGTGASRPAYALSSQPATRSDKDKELLSTSSGMRECLPFVLENWPVVLFGAITLTLTIAASCLTARWPAAL